MKIKWNWGTKLAIWISLFIIFILSLVYMTTTVNVNLVEKDYYPKGLIYQSRINAINNAKEINAVFITTQSDTTIVINMPDIQVDSGTIMFFRPSQNALDKNYKLIINSNREFIISL